MQHYELMSIHTTKKGLPDKWGEPTVFHDYDAELPEYNSTDSVDSDPCAIGKPIEIIRYILKNDLPEYKLVKRKRKLTVR